MKNFKLLFLPLLAIVFSLSGCEQIENENLGKKNKFTESGLYLGIIGFNSDLQEKEITLLNENSIYNMINFINNLNMEKETILFYAVDEAINKLENTTFPSDIKSVNIVTFTDGLDVGSIRKNGEYKTDSEYLKAINTRLKETKISGLDINAYSIGIAGSDVTNKARFKDNLIGLATAEENAFEVSNMKEVNNKFEQIANSLYKKNTIPSLTLQVPYHGDGVKIRYTFDNIGNNITKSTQYIEATFKIISETEIKLENFYFRNCKCDNISNNSQLTISVKSETDPFLLKLENFTDKNNKTIPTTYLQESFFDKEYNVWQLNSEFDKANDTKIEEEKSTAVIILVLDCSSSLDKKFTNLKSSAKSFIEVLLKGSNNNNSDPDQDPDPNQDPDPEPTPITVRLNSYSASTWNDVYLYSWNEEIIDICGSWPGTEVSKTNGWWSFTFPKEISNVNIIWNNGQGEQTIDIIGVTESTCYELVYTSTNIEVVKVDCNTNPSNNNNDDEIVKIIFEKKVSTWIDDIIGLGLIKENTTIVDPYYMFYDINGTSEEMNINMGTYIPAILLEGEEYWRSWTTTEDEDETWAVTFNKPGTYIYIVEESDEYLRAKVFETSNSYVQKQTPKANFKILKKELYNMQRHKSPFFFNTK